MIGEPSAILGGPGHALVYPSGMEVAPDGTLVVADTGNDSVAKFRPTGTLVWRVSAGTGEGDEAENARDIAVDDQGFIYVADAAEFRIIKLDPVDGHTIMTFNGPAGDRLGSPIGITAKKNKIYVSDGLVSAHDPNAGPRSIRYVPFWANPESLFVDEDVHS